MGLLVGSGPLRAYFHPLRRLQRDFPLLGEVGGYLRRQLHEFRMPCRAHVLFGGGLSRYLLLTLQASLFAGTLLRFVGYISFGTTIVTEIESFVNVHTQRAIPLVVPCRVTEGTEGLYPSASLSACIDV